MKVAGCRGALYPLCAYSDTAVVTSCSRQSVREVMNRNISNKVFSVSSSSYTAPKALVIRQEVEQIRANVFYSTFLNVFLFFLERFLHLFFFGPRTCICLVLHCTV